MTIRISLNHDGFTLVEVIMASLVGLIMALGISQVNQFMARNAAVQSGNASFQMLVADISGRLIDVGGNGASHPCAQTLGNGTPNPVLNVQPTGFDLVLYNYTDTTASPPFLSPGQVYGNVKVLSIHFNPIQASYPTATPNVSSVLGNLVIWAVRTADLNIAPRPTPSMQATIPLNIEFNNAPTTLFNCGRISTASTQPQSVPTCSPGQYLYQNPPNLGSTWQCNNIP